MTDSDDLEDQRLAKILEDKNAASAMDTSEEGVPSGKEEESGKALDESLSITNLSLEPLERDALAKSSKAVVVGALLKYCFEDRGLETIKLIKDLMKRLSTMKNAHSFGALLTNYLSDGNIDWDDALFDMIVNLPRDALQEAADAGKVSEVLVTPFSIAHVVNSTPYGKIVGGEARDTAGFVDIIPKIYTNRNHYDVNVRDVQTLYTTAIPMFNDIESNNGHRYRIAEMNIDIYKLTAFVMVHFRVTVDGIRVLFQLQPRSSSKIALHYGVQKKITEVLEKLDTMLKSLSSEFDPEESTISSWVYWHLWRILDVLEEKKVLAAFRSIAGFYDGAKHEYEVKDKNGKVVIDPVTKKPKLEPPMTELEKALKSADDHFVKEFDRVKTGAGETLYPRMLEIEKASALFFGQNKMGKHTENMMNTLTTPTISSAAPRDAVLCSMAALGVDMLVKRNIKVENFVAKGVDNPEFLNTIVEARDNLEDEFTRKNFDKKTAKAFDCFKGVKFEYTPAAAKGIYTNEKVHQLKFKGFVDVVKDYKRPNCVHMIVSNIDLRAPEEKPSDSAMFKKFAAADMWNPNSVYIIRHSAVPISEYKLFYSSMRARGYSVDLKHHPRLTSTEVFAFVYFDPLNNILLAEMEYDKNAPMVDFRKDIATDQVEVNNGKFKEGEKPHENTYEGFMGRAKSWRVIKASGFFNDGNPVDDVLVSWGGKRYFIGKPAEGDVHPLAAKHEGRNISRMIMSYATCIEMVKLRVRRVATGAVGPIQFDISKLQQFVNIGAFMVAAYVHNARKKTFGKSYKAENLKYGDILKNFVATDFITDLGVPTYQTQFGKDEGRKSAGPKRGLESVDLTGNVNPPVTDNNSVPSVTAMTD